MRRVVEIMHERRMMVSLGWQWLRQRGRTTCAVRGNVSFSVT